MVSRKPRYSEGSVMLCSDNFLMASSHREKNSLCPSFFPLRNGVGDLEEAVQHIPAFIIAIKLTGVHDLEQLLSVVLGLHPAIALISLSQILHVVKRDTAEVTQQARAAARRLCLRGGKPQASSDQVVVASQVGGGPALLRDSRSSSSSSSSASLVRRLSLRRFRN